MHATNACNLETSTGYKVLYYLKNFDRDYNV